jgi:hypothetical protein
LPSAGCTAAAAQICMASLLTKPQLLVCSS